MTLTAICGELPADQLHRLGSGPAYRSKVISALKQRELLLAHHRDGLRAYRITLKAKEALCRDAPDRFLFSLTGASDTNHIRSEPPRRLRLHRIAEATITMMNAGVTFHRDEKPAIFSPAWEPKTGPDLSLSVFYNSREMKELGRLFLKIRGTRAVGVLLTEEQILVTYNIGSGQLQWEYRAEMRLKAMMQDTLCDRLLSSHYTRGDVQLLLLGRSMEAAYRILSQTGGRQYFLLDGNYDRVYFLTNDRYGEGLLRLLYSPELQERLDSILLADYYEADEGSTLENDGFDENDDPVLLAYLFELQRIERFTTALRVQKRTGTIFCFDFQADVLARYCGERVRLKAIDYQKWERSFLG